MGLFQDSGKLLKRIGYGSAILIAGLLIVNAFLNWRAGVRLESRLVELRSKDMPTSISELQSENVVDAENIAVQIEPLRERLAQFDRESFGFFQTPVGKEIEVRWEKGEALQAEQLAEVMDMLAGYAVLLEELERIAKLRNYASILDNRVSQEEFLEHNLSNVEPMRQIGRLLDKQMKVLVELDNPDAAVALGIDLMRLCRHRENEPSLVSYLVVIACRSVAIGGLNRALRHDALSSEMQVRLMEELELQKEAPGIQHAMQSERALGLDILASWREGGAGKFIGWYYTNWQCEFVDFYDECLPIFDLPWCEGKEKFEAIPKNSIAVQMSAQGMLSTYDASSRDLATRRCLAILNALKMYEIEHGEEANGLSDLSIPESDTLDPYSGKPLIVKRMEKGWAVYSVQLNGVDDNGKMDDLSDWGLLP